MTHTTLALWAAAHLDTWAGLVVGQAATPTPTPPPIQGGVLPLSSTVMVRALTLGAVAFILTLILAKPIINWLRDRGIGKQIRVDGPPNHQVKTGTPTMGGIIFLIPLVIVIGVFMDILRFKSLLLPLGIVISCGILGGFDDLLSTVGRNRGGLTARFKMAWLLVIGTIAAWIISYPLGHQGVIIPFVRNP